MLDEIGNVLALADARLWSALVARDVQLSFFAFRWVVCLLVREFDIANTLLLWDAYVALGPCFPRFHLFLCAALVLHERAAIADAELYQVVSHMQSMGTAAWRPAQLRALLRAAVLLSEKYPFPDDPSARNRRLAPSRSNTSSSSSSSSIANTLSQVPARVLDAVERTPLVDALAKTMRAVVVRLGGAPGSVAHAKRVVACMVVLAAVCLTATGTVLALRRAHAALPQDDTLDDPLTTTAAATATAAPAALDDGTSTTTTTTTMP